MTDPRHLPYEIQPNLNRFHYYETHWKKCGLQLLLKYFPPGENSTVLDYGCGRGEVLEIFGGAGYQVTGTDVDPKCIEVSSRKGHAVILDPHDPCSQFGEKSFDFITCFHVLEHVDNPKRIAESLARIARKGVVFAVPNLRNLTGILRRKIQIESINEGHLQGWDHAHFLRQRQ
jgi:2-polyprenyl-3-methyl-5-hydroxy-6-metoxy-1,4-benzoquinol methylase